MTRACCYDSAEQRLNTASCWCRSAGKGALEGAVGICLPTYLPDASSADADRDGMYFVTVRLQPSQSTRLSAVAESPASPADPTEDSKEASFRAELQTFVPGKVSLSTCRYPQLDHVNSRGTATSASSKQQQKPGLWQDLEVVVMTGRQQMDHSSDELQGDPGLSSMQSWDAESNSNFSIATASVDGLYSSTGSLCSNSLRLGYNSLSSAAAARMVCRKIDGLVLGGQIAAGSYGRVFRGDYFGTRVS